MIKTTGSLAIIFFVFLMTAATAFAQATVTAEAEKRSREFVGVVSSGDRAAIEAYANANFGEQMTARIPKPQVINFLLSVYDGSRGWDVNGVQESKPTSVTLLLKNKLTGEWEALFVGVEDTEPYKIAAIGFRNPKPPASEAKVLSPKEIDAEMKGYLKRLVDANVFSGTVLLAKDGKPIFTGAYGIANRDFDAPVKLDTKFNLGSMNKMFTAVAIAQLVEKGKLSFDDPLSKFIPDFPDAESAQKIKIKHLLSHTAGLGGYFTRRYQDTSRANLRTVDDMMALAKQDEKLLFEPGTKWQYSNTGMLVLGKVIEIVSGQSYFDYVRENIYKPAGMINTDSYELDKVNPNLAVGYDKEFTKNGVVYSNNIFAHVMRGGPQGGGYSTVEDLLRFDQALQSGKLVSPEMFKTLTTPKPELNSPNYGYGFEASDGQAGHGGGFTGINSNLTMFLRSGWTAIVMSNLSRGAGPVAQKMERIIKQAEGAPATAAAK